ncbi:hypothetical protein AAP_03935 [Ascosphaera apis ARSEF 7405]|uniref:Uncharacterized protein n=1 Tax=Ascosphaera apis ARSEF 7405 TaxID=392613 RepID=A0A167XS49_9EURO|nr:hypothetical protein AAP_03935 [Ascosphaera apis ARSEF 7405]
MMMFEMELDSEPETQPPAISWKQEPNATTIEFEELMDNPQQDMVLIRIVWQSRFDEIECLDHRQLFKYIPSANGHFSFQGCKPFLIFIQLDQVAPMYGTDITISEWYRNEAGYVQRAMNRFNRDEMLKWFDVARQAKALGRTQELIPSEIGNVNELFCAICESMANCALSPGYQLCVEDAVAFMQNYNVKTNGADGNVASGDGDCTDAHVGGHSNAVEHGAGDGVAGDGATEIDGAGLNVQSNFNGASGFGGRGLA